ncbi:MAG: FliH/SctL family protein [Salinisphaeraceae bacterium]|nr:FliH/SctL family protein [Salinisphaeraceae bacterium]
MSNDSSVASQAAKRWQMPDLGNSSVNQDGSPLHTAEELDRISTSAREEGFDQGYQEGKAAGLAHADVLLTRVHGVMENLVRPLQALDEEIEHELLQLSLKLCERILRKQLPMDPEAMAGFIREGIELLQPTDRQVSIHLCPDDATALGELLGKDNQDWRIMHDRMLQPGDVRIQTDSGALDGRLPVRLEAMLNDLLENRAHEGDS